MPNLEHLLRGLAHCDGHLDRALGRFRCGQGVVEEYHDPIAAVVIERAFKARHNRPERSVVVAQERHDLFRLGALGEGCEAADVAEYDDNLAAMALKDALVALSDDEV